MPCRAWRGCFRRAAITSSRLTVAPTEDPTLSRMTIVTSGSDAVIEQINKQLNKLIDVAAVMDLSEGEHLERELMLIKVRAEGGVSEEMKHITDIFRAGSSMFLINTLTIELTDTGARLDAFLEAIGHDLILETVRTGASGIGRGERILKL